MIDIEEVALSLALLLLLCCSIKGLRTMNASTEKLLEDPIIQKMQNREKTQTKMDVPVLAPEHVEMRFRLNEEFARILLFFV